MNRKAAAITVDRLQKTCPADGTLRRTTLCIVAFFVVAVVQTVIVQAGQLRAGAAKIDITRRDGERVNDPLYARAVVISDGETMAVVVGVDAVSLGEIGHISNEYLGDVRAELAKDPGIEPNNIIINASHCHGIVCKDVDARTVKVIRQAAKNMVPVHVGVGRGHEDRIQENRRIKLKDGRTIDVRHAYSMPTDADVAEVGPIDPEIGVLRLDAMDGRTVAVLYNFACHPIQNVPLGGNTADMTGFSSQVIEDNLSDGAVAVFIQGCGGDINPVAYKAVDYPRHAEPLGNMLALSTLKAVRKVEVKQDDRLKVINETIALPRADTAQRIIELESEQLRLARSLGGTTLNLKTFMPLAVKYGVNGEFPSYYAALYLHEEKLGREHLKALDAQNRAAMKSYIRNIRTMEQLTRVNTNLRLLKKHQASFVKAGKRTLDVELTGLRVGNFVLTSFPGELTVQIGLNIKKKSPHDMTFVAGYTNGYIYYAPTDEQLLNVGGAQEDSDCMVAPGWQKIYEAKAADILSRL